MKGLIEGQIVVLSHPHLYDVMVLARVEGKPTKSMFEARYYTSRGWHEVTRRRKLDAVVGALPEGADPDAVLDRLTSAQARMNESIKRARVNWRETVRKEVVA